MGRAQRAMARSRGLLAAFALPLLMSMLSAPASAQNCSSWQVPAMSVSSMNAGSYDPFVASTPLIVTVTVQTTAACALALTFSRASLPAVMSSPGFTLQYTVEAVGGGPTYLTTVLPPAPANRLAFIAPAAGFHTVQVQLRVPDGQIVNAATYSDTGLTARVYNIRTSGALQLRRSVAVTPQATVIRSCRLDAPSPSTISFAPSEIPDGLPNPGIVKSATMTAACTAPALLRLTGSALTPTPAIAPATGFDNFINYRAVGTFGAASATLVTTTTTSTVTSAARNVPTGPTSSGTVGVAINLEPNQTVLAGNYSGVLTVTIDPSP